MCEVWKTKSAQDFEFKEDKLDMATLKKTCADLVFVFLLLHPHIDTTGTD